MTIERDLESLLAVKRHEGKDSGFDPKDLNPNLFPFQEHLTRWAIRKGRSGIFADCGLGKTIIQLSAADAIANHTGRRVLVLTPLAVGFQTIDESEKFGIGCSLATSKDDAQIHVANYQKLHLLDPSRYSGIICDESSILKSFDGATKHAITIAMRKVHYRLLCSATPAPNDFQELGTSAEALGYLGYMDMLGKFFKADDGRGSAATRAYGSQVKFRLKSHAEHAFWRWVCSWARAIREPSDLGFSDAGYDLPALMQNEHVVQGRSSRADRLFDVAAVRLDELREEQRRTVAERCEKVASLIAESDSAIAWCQLNQEGDLLEKLIPGAIQVSGKDSDDAKEEKLRAFQTGKARVLVTKPTIGAWGLNFQHCAHQTFFPSHSFEQFYQSVRRSWRFGQRRPVVIDVVTTEGGRGCLESLDRKSKQSDEMFERIVSLMTNELAIMNGDKFDSPVEVPAWL